MHRVAVLIFAKYPEPGRVKTRLVPPLTPEEAASIHTACLRVVCDSAIRLTHNRAAPREDEVGPILKMEPVLVVSPDDALQRMRNLVGDGMHTLRPQGGGDLGERLSRATDHAFADGVRAVILLGADSPTLPRSILQDAVAAVTQNDAVLGPCDDGGYYLLGMRRPLPELFRNIDWGGERVTAQTRERAAGADLDLFELPTWYDLDRFDDLQRAMRDLNGVPDPPPATLELRRLIETLVTRHDHE